MNIRMTPVRTACTALFWLLLGLPLAWSATPDTVRNHSHTVDLGEASRYSSSQRISRESGVMVLKHDAADGLATSVAIEAPEVSTHLGVAWSGSGAVGLAVRTSLDGVEWSGWFDVVADGHMTDHETGTYYSRLASVAGGYRYIQYSAGFARTAADPKSPQLDSLAFSFIQAGSVPANTAESIVTDKPAMLSRTQWGCPDGETSSNNPNPTYTEVTHLIVHHTVTSNNASDWAAEVRAMWSYHVQTRGWADIGYNFLLDPEGTIYVGRAGGDNVQGAHFSCRNGGTQGIAVIGDFTSVQPTQLALDSLDELLAWLASREDLDPTAVSWHDGTQLNLGTISGHRDGNTSTTGCTVTACPGDLFYPMLPDVRSRVQALIAEAQIPGPVIRDQLSEVVAVFSGNAEAGLGCHGLFEVNGHVVANLYRAEQGCRLFRMDAEGPVLLADIDTMPDPASPAGVGAAPPLAGWHYFEGKNTEGNGLWRTDGTLVEPVLTSPLWPGGGVLSGRGQMNGRLYFTVRDALGAQTLFSTDGLETRVETALDGDGAPAAELGGSLFSRLLLSATDPSNGREPRVFDGDVLELLADIAPGEAASEPRLFMPLDDQWIFVARKSENETAFFRTDGALVAEIPSADSWVDDLDADDPFISSSGAIYMARNQPPPAMDPAPTPTSIMRLKTGNVTAYALDNANGDTATPSLAVLGNKALVLVENRFYHLGDTSAEELPYPFPTDQAGSEYRFIGSDPYFSHAYIEEINGDHFSQVWAWNETELGSLLAGESNPVTTADHFRPVGDDIWFYGEDAVNGRALRRIEGAASLVTPLLGAITGAWYDPDTSGQGFVMHPIDDTRAVISFYGYENDGSLLWLLGTAETPIELGRESEITMYISSGGKFGDFIPTDVNTVSWGTLRVTFGNCRNATATLSGDHGQQTLALIRLAGLAGLECKSPTPPIPQLSGVTGTWYDPDTAGQGLVLHAIDEARILVSFYGYRDDSSRLWLLDVYEGEPVFGEGLTLNLTRASGGRFGPFDPLDIERETWGTMTIDFQDCGVARATLTGEDGQQTMELVKLAGLRGSARDCPENTAAAAR